MIPLRDSLPTLRLPLLTLLLIVINVAIFAFSISRPDATLPDASSRTPVSVDGYERFTAEWGFKPCEVLDRCDKPGVFELSDGDGEGSEEVSVARHSVILLLLSAMFMHGGILHLLGNMVFLWVFGNNIEDSLGRLRFLAFYLVAGLLASATQLLTDPDSNIPNIGASGAIAGVLGGYILLHPRARVLTVIPLLVFFTIVEVPALVVLGVWFGLQLLDASASLAGPEGVGGVAYWAHVGGFVAGLILVRLFMLGAGRRARPMIPLAPS